MSNFNRISINPNVVNGQPCIVNTRITVKRVIEAVALYQQWDKVIEEYPGLDVDDIFQSLEWAAINMDDQFIALDVA